MTASERELCTLNYQRRGPVAFVELNRPDKLNAISEQMVAELNVALDRAEADEAVHAIILSGRGRAFSAGFDLDDPFEDDSVEAARKALTPDFDIIMRFWRCPKPTIAAVHGYCLGGALEMAVACDITVAAEDARFGVPEVRFGSGSVVLILPWVIGVKQAKELMLTGADNVSASRALQLGLINRLTPAADLHQEAESIARDIALNDTIAVRETKAALNRACEMMGMEEALQDGLETDIRIETQQTPESTRFNEILAQQGTKAALAWRARQVLED